MDIDEPQDDNCSTVDLDSQLSEIDDYRQEILLP